MLCVTPLALLISQLARPRAVGPLVVDRLGETALGAVVGIAGLLLTHRSAE